MEMPRFVGVGEDQLMILDRNMILAGFKQAAGGVGHVDDPKVRIEQNHAVTDMLQTSKKGAHALQCAVFSPAWLRAALDALEGYTMR